MIKVFLTEKYKSLLTNMYVELPDFTIISGVNGAGKSHLLKAIDEKVAKVLDGDDAEITPARYINSNSLTPNDSYQVGRDHYTNEINSIYNSIRGFIDQKKSQPGLTLEKYSSNYGSNYFNIISLIEKDSQKILPEITHEDIKEYMPIYSNLVQDIFYQNFSAIFKRYSDRFDDNIYNEFLSNHKGIHRKFLTHEQFTNKFGTPPWEFVNRIFEEANIGYSINNPVQDDRDLPYFFKLVNKSNGANVNFNDLSSGEKVLMSLALALYNAKLDIPFPKLIMFDEPDAPLHPSMANQLLRVIREVFVIEKGVKVIMTTHSPSTIAMADEESLFVMQKEEPRLMKMSQDKILKLLTAGIPSLSINTYNIRQVFVESDVDVSFYTKLYIKLKQEIKSDISLNFLSSGVAKNNSGNCEQVKGLVKQLSEKGNQTIFGIIDWDNSNKSTDKVFVLGENKRYSIENYVYDPIILTNFILREKNIKSKDYFCLEESDKFFEFPNYPTAKLQKVVDVIIRDVQMALGISTIQDIVKVQYLGKNKQSIYLNIPRWYLTYQGHELEDVIKGVYPKLKQFRDLKKNIIDKVIDDLPEFISMDFLDLFEKMHS